MTRWLAVNMLGIVWVYGATLNVKNYGALGNGTADDTPAIQAAVNASSSGDTILFPAGKYRLKRMVNVASNRTYQGQGSAVLLGVGGQYTFQTPWNTTTNITFNGLTFDGAPLVLAGDSVPAWNIHITNCIFQNITTVSSNWTTELGIFIASGLTNSNISNNTFRNILPNGQANTTSGFGPGIWGTNVSTTSISGNTCDTVYQCMYFTSDGQNRPGIVISNNTAINVHRMGLEMQMSGCSVQITGNTFTNFLNPFYDTFGISFASNSCQGQIQNNTLIASPKPNPSFALGRYGYAIEAAGIRTVVSNNTIQGEWNAGVAIGESTYIKVINNSLCGSSGAMAIHHENSAHVVSPMVQANSVSPVCPSTFRH